MCDEPSRYTIKISSFPFQNLEVFKDRKKELHSIIIIIDMSRVSAPKSHEHKYVKKKKKMLELKFVVLILAFRSIRVCWKVLLTLSVSQNVSAENLRIEKWG